MLETARETFRKFVVAFWVLLAVLYVLTVKSVFLIAWTLGAMSKLLIQNWGSLISSIQRVTAFCTDMCLDWWDDLHDSLELLLYTTNGLSQLVIGFLFASLAALGHLVLQSWECINQNLNLHQPWNSTADAAQEGGRRVSRWIQHTSSVVCDRVGEVEGRVIILVHIVTHVVIWLVLRTEANWMIVLGFIWGLVIGVGVMNSWARMIVKVSKQREESICGTATLTRPGDQTQIKEVLGVKTHAARETAFEKIDWVNRLVKRAWPHIKATIDDHQSQVREFLEDFVEGCRLRVLQVIDINEAEQSVRRYIPTAETITGVYLNGLNLGTSAPTLEGIKLQDMTDDNRSVMDVKLKWKSEASTFTLGVGTSEGVLKVLVQDLEVVATLRIVVYFVESPPFASVIVLFSPTKSRPIVSYSVIPEEDFALHHWTRVERELKDLLHAAIQDSLQWPHRLIVVPPWAAQPSMDTEKLRLKPHGQLHVTILKGENLVNLYAYILLYVRAKVKVRTRSVDNCPNPVWNEEFCLDSDDQASQSLILQVMNECKGSDELVGIVSYELAKLKPDVDFEVELPIQQVGSREIDGRSLQLVLRYHVYTEEEQEGAQASEEKLERALASPEATSSFVTAAEILRG